MTDLLNNPILLIGLLCLCWPGILPIAGAFLLARNYNVRISRRTANEV